MSQSRKGSFAEACMNTASGFVVSLLVWQWIVAPLFELPVSWGMNFWITAIFTVVSILRSYLWRRFFERRLWRVLYLRRWLRAAE